MNDLLTAQQSSIFRMNYTNTGEREDSTQCEEQIQHVKSHSSHLLKTHIRSPVLATILPS